jgi:hypothetical protein
MAEDDFLPLCMREFQKLKGSIENSLIQISAKDYHRRLDPNANTIAELMKHLAGNTRSRCLNFLNSDGEKPDRDRDGEFVSAGNETPEQLGKELEAAWTLLFSEYGALTADDLQRTVYIRSEPHSVRRALLRQLTHHAGHAGQIVLLAKHFAGEKWQTLSVPRGKSGEFAKMMREKFEAKQ